MVLRLNPHNLVVCHQATMTSNVCTDPGVGVGATHAVTTTVVITLIRKRQTDGWRC